MRQDKLSRAQTCAQVLGENPDKVPQCQHQTDGWQEWVVKKPGVVVHAYNPGAWEAEVGRSGVRGHLWRHSEFEAMLWYMRVCLKKQKPISNKKCSEGKGFWQNLDFPRSQQTLKIHKYTQHNVFMTHTSDTESYPHSRTETRDRFSCGNITFQPSGCDQVWRDGGFFPFVNLAGH